MSDRDDSNRRDFLLGKSVRDNIAARIERKHAIDLEAKPTPPAVTRSSLERQQAYVEQFAAKAMACEFEWTFNLHQYPEAGESAAAGFTLLEKLEQQLSIYRQDSEVSELNREASRHPVNVESGLFRLLERGQQISRDTNGAFDMTSGPLSKVWGFERRQGKLPDEQEIKDVLSTVGWQKVNLNRDTQQVSFSSPSLSLNLGGIGKGYALDRVAGEFLSRGMADFILHGGQSSLLARGSSEVTIRSTDSLSDEPGKPPAGWKVGLSHPAMPGVRLGEITLRDQALGTSGTAKQGFYHRGKRYGHIIDPRTGWPAVNYLSTTVVANSAADADALATAFFVMPIEEIEAFCSSHAGVGAILVSAVNKSSAHTKVSVINVDRFQLVSDCPAED